MSTTPLSEIYPRKETLRALADGEHLTTYFGTDREPAAHQLASILRGIEPEHGDRMEAALLPCPRLQRRIRAYDRGMDYLRSAYHGYGY